MATLSRRNPHWSARTTLERHGVEKEKQRKGGTRTSCMRVQRNSNRDTTVDPATNYTYGSYYAREQLCRSKILSTPAFILS